MGTDSVQLRMNEQRRNLGLPEVDYDALMAEINADPATEQSAISMDAEADSEFAVEGMERELQEGDETEYLAQEADDSSSVAYETNREQMFHEQAEDARDRNFGKSDANR